MVKRLKITIMVGNGFDMALGIKSSYTEFYKWYCKQPSPNKDIDKLKEDIENENTWADLELGLGTYTKKFDQESVDKYIECYEDIQNEIITYLGIQVDEFNIDAYSQTMIDSFSHSIWNFYDEVSDQEKNAIKDQINSVLTENKEFTFISFNYTNALEQILERIQDVNLSTWKYNSNVYAYRLNKNVIHVHGTTTDYPILGVNDDSQITNRALLSSPQFREIVIKPETVNELGKLWHQQAEAQISASRVVCIMGMSLGKSDARWWRKLVKWLKESQSRHLIIYQYEKDPPNGISAIKQIRYVNGAKDKFLSYSDISDEEKKAIKTRIHVVINTQKFLRLPIEENDKIDVLNEEKSLVKA